MRPRKRRSAAAALRRPALPLPPRSRFDFAVTSGVESTPVSTSSAGSTDPEVYEGTRAVTGQLVRHPIPLEGPIVASATGPLSIRRAPHPLPVLAALVRAVSLRQQLQRAHQTGTDRRLVVRAGRARFVAAVREEPLVRLDDHRRVGVARLPVELGTRPGDVEVERLAVEQPVVRARTGPVRARRARASRSARARPAAPAPANRSARGRRGPAGSRASCRSRPRRRCRRRAPGRRPARRHASARSLAWTSW